MFKPADKSVINQISLTGMRAIVFMGLLIRAPRSFNEIRRALTELKIMEETSSDDILRIDLNTIKHIGCEISRCSAKTGYKYILTKHPFELKIPKEEIDVLKKVYNKIKSNTDIETLIKYHQLFQKISNHICDEKTKEALLGISSLRHYDIKIVKEFLADAKHKRRVSLVYKKPTYSKEYRKDIIVQNLIFENDKLHLHCYDIFNKKSIVLNLKRVVSVISRNFNSSNIESKTKKVIFFITDASILDVNEVVVETTPNGFIVEGEYHNDFIATQRILSFGSKCTVIEPIEFKRNIIEKIREMRKTYEN